jgi:hypothetical protein
MITLMLMAIVSFVTINIIARNTKKKIEEKKSSECGCGGNCRCEVSGD